MHQFSSNTCLTDLPRSNKKTNTKIPLDTLETESTYHFCLKTEKLSMANAFTTTKNYLELHYTLTFLETKSFIRPLTDRISLTLIKHKFNDN